MAELKRGRGLIRISKNKLLKLLNLPNTYNIVVIKMKPMFPDMIDITVEGPGLNENHKGRKLQEIDNNEGKNE